MVGPVSDIGRQKERYFFLKKSLADKKKGLHLHPLREWAVVKKELEKFIDIL